MPEKYHRLWNVCALSRHANTCAFRLQWLCMKWFRDAISTFCHVMTYLMLMYAHAFINIRATAPCSCTTACDDKTMSKIGSFIIQMKWHWFATLSSVMRSPNMTRDDDARNVMRGTHCPLWCRMQSITIKMAYVCTCRRLLAIHSYLGCCLSTHRFTNENSPAPALSWRTP